MTITQADRNRAHALAKALGITHELSSWEHLYNAFAAHREAAEARAKLEGAKAMQEWAKRLVQQRMDDRFEEHGTREWDTNATYYQGSRAETLEELDEEDEAIRDAIAVADLAQIAGDRKCVISPLAF